MSNSDENTDLLAADAAKTAFIPDTTTGGWRDIFFDSGCLDRNERRFLDDELGIVCNSTEGTKLAAGQEFIKDAQRVVLWTRGNFVGDLKIGYEDTRLDLADQCVTILYVQAPGSGHGPSSPDIARCNELRHVPPTSVYSEHMHTYHLSNAAFEGSETTGYVSARRCMPDRSGLEDTDLKSDYFPTGLFNTGVPHRITVIKRSHNLFMRIENAGQPLFCHMTSPNLPEIKRGRVGLRHMLTRSARDRNFRISTPAP